MPTMPYKTSKGERVPGTTSVISGNLGWATSPLCHWANAQGLAGVTYQEAMKPAASIGTATHAMAEADITGKDVDLGTDDPELIAKAQVAFEGYLSWKRSSNLKLIASEVAIVDDELKYGGCLDAVGTINDKPCLIDFKTSKGGNARESHLLQLAAYATLWERSHPDLILTGGYHLLIFNKESGGFAHHFFPYGSLAPAWEAFTHCLALHRLKKVVGGMA